MRLIHGATSLLLIGALAACSGGDVDDTKDRKTAGKPPERFIACDLLTQAQREKAVGAEVAVQGRPDADFPVWTCAFGNTPEISAPNQVSYRAMRAPIWAKKFPDVIAADPGAQKLLADVLKNIGVAQEELASMDSDSACDLWTALNEAAGNDVIDGMTSQSSTDEDLNMHIARAGKCSEGVYADVLVGAPDADSPAGRKRAETALSTVHANALKRLPR